MLLLRPLLPDQGPAGARRAGGDHRGLLHLLRLLRERLLPGRQARRLLASRRAGDPGGARSRIRAPGALVPRGVPRPSPRATGRAPCTPRASTACTRWPSAPTSWRYEYARRFHELQERGSEDFLISTPCPAVVQYVEKVLPELAPHLAGIVSPMEATARVVRQKLCGQEESERARLVFIGPCVAKKVEAWRSGEVDAVLTFAELAELFADARMDPAGGARPRISALRTPTSAGSTR